MRELPRPIREQIVDELGEEFSAKGLKPDGEPNAYGLEMETLTDACGLAGMMFTIPLVVAMPMIRLHETVARHVTVCIRQVEA